MTPFLGAGAVVVDRSGAILLVIETGVGKEGRWSLPAGKVQPDESFEAAMKREVLEETGIDVRSTGLLGLYHSTRTVEGVFGVNAIFLAELVRGEPTPSPEHPDVRFIGRDEIASMLLDGVFRSGELMQTVLADLDAGRSLPEATIRTLGP